MTLVATTTNRITHRLFTQNYSVIRNLTSITEEKIINVEDEESDTKIDRICNKSRLRPQHRNLLFGQKPFSEPVNKAHATIKYNRKLYGTYGNASGVNLGIMWPTKSDIIRQKEYEKVAFPFTINEMIDAANAEIQRKENQVDEQQKKVIANMTKLEMWKKQLKDTIAKKEADALAAKEKKEKLLEEVRRHFGFTVDPRDERFKEMLALKEKEMKKKEKQAKAQDKEKKALAKLMEKHTSDLETKS